MHAIYVRDLENRRPGLLLAADIEDVALAERLVRSIASSYPRNGCDEAEKACWFRDERGLHRIWSEPVRGAASGHAAVDPARWQGHAHAGRARSSAA